MAAAEPGPPPPAVSPAPAVANPFAEGKVTLFFLHNSNELTREAMGTLDQVADYLKTRPELRIDIRGYTDSVGTISYNLSVSQFRANSIKSYLVGKGVSEGNITALGMGPKDPIASNETPAGREQNRRVEIAPSS